MPDRWWVSRGALAGAAAAFAVTTVAGASVLTVEYRLFHGPDTGQLVVVWIFATLCSAAALGPAAVLLGAALGNRAARARPTGLLVVAFMTLAGVAHSATYALISWFAAHRGLGSDLFELRWQIVPVAAITGIITGPFVVWEALKTSRPADAAAG